MNITVEITKLAHGADLPLPAYATAHSSGVDLYAATEEVVIKAGAFIVVPTGISIALPDGYEAQIRPRSGLAAKNGITVLNTPGTIDNDYRGEIKVILINHSNVDFVVTNGMRIAQMIIARYYQVNWSEKSVLGTTERGAGGFGSTGISN